jgi:hypothetical protein
MGDDFTASTGLAINFHKSTFIPIHIEAGEAAALSYILECPIASFPKSYLGLSLSCKKLPPAALDCLVVRVERYILGWRVHLLNKGGHLTNIVLMAQLTYAAVAIRFPKMVVDRIDKPCHGML